MKVITFDNMDVYLPEKYENVVRPMVVIFPGGAYEMHADIWEGEWIAMAWCAAGFSAAVVRYSVAPNRFPQPLLDAAAAVKRCREESKNWNIDANGIAVCGFSAGGHLAAALSTLWNDTTIFSPEEIESARHRPDAAILCYPVITSGEKAHRGSFENLLGTKDEQAPLWKAMSLETRVHSQTAPTFLWHTVGDKTVPVENTMLYAAALQKNGVPFECHIYPKGDHGLSLAAKNLPRTRPVFNRDYGWMKLAIDWLSDIFNL